MDSTAIASVVSSATVALATLGVNAWTRRSDRRHESELDYARRTWEAKSSALITVISKCDTIRSAVPSVTFIDEQQFMAHRRIAIITAFELVGSSLANQAEALLAYSPKSVWELVARLNTIIRQERKDHAADLVRIKTYREEQESLVESLDLKEASRFYERELKTAYKMGESCTLDIDSVHALCDSIIDAARKDLRGA